MAYNFETDIIHTYDFALALEAVEAVWGAMGRLTFDASADYNTEECLATGNHFFSWGAETYDNWQMLDSCGWVAELVPTYGEQGEVVGYTVLEIERVE
jgi:hypothetical protein